MYNNNVMMTSLNTGVQLTCTFILASRGNNEHMHHFSDLQGHHRKSRIYNASHSFSSPKT